MDGQALQKAFVALPAGATAVYDSSGLEYYRHADWLGSVRLVSTPSRTVSGDTAYAPFGYGYAQSGSPAVSFTGQNQDTATNLYDFMYREYGIQGRWVSPDPLDTGAFNLADPQSLDRYAYVRNSPMGLVDPLGYCPAGTEVITTEGGYECIPLPYPGAGPGNGSGVSCNSFVGVPSGDCPPVPYPNPMPTGQGGASPQTPGRTKTCTASARVLQGNPATVGAPLGHGAFNNRPNPVAPQAGSAAMTPSEFGGFTTTQLKPYALRISGYFPGNGVSFQGVTDVNGAGHTPRGFGNIREYLEFLNPGQIIIELITGPDLGSNVPVVLTVPAALPCPTAPPFITDPVMGPTVG